MVEVKGAVISDSIKAVIERSGKEVLKNILNHLNSDIRKVFEGSNILSIGWYPLDIFVQFLDADIKITANGNEKELVLRSETIVEKQLRGIYKIFIKIGSPGFVIDKISIIHKTYFKGVSIETKMINSKTARIKYIGFEKQHRLIGLSLIGFYKKALEISGAKDIKTMFITSIEQGKGFCELEITWTHK